MSILAFQATTVITEHPEGICHFVGFADDPESPETYLFLQRDFGDNTNSPHLEWCDQSTSGYGLVESATLNTDYLAIVLTSKGRDLLGGATQIDIAFSISIQTFQQLQQSLAQVFHGSGGFHAPAA